MLQPWVEKKININLKKLCLFVIRELIMIYDYFESSAWAAANLATGTLNGEQET